MCPIEPYGLTRFQNLDWTDFECAKAERQYTEFSEMLRRRLTAKVEPRKYTVSLLPPAMHYRGTSEDTHFVDDSDVRMQEGA